MRGDKRKSSNHHTDCDELQEEEFSHRAKALLARLLRLNVLLLPAKLNQVVSDAGEKEREVDALSSTKQKSNAGEVVFRTFANQLRASSRARRGYEGHGMNEGDTKNGISNQS